MKSIKVLYEDPSGYTVIQVFTMRGNSIRVTNPTGGWLTNARGITSFKNLETAKRRIRKEASHQG